MALNALEMELLENGFRAKVEAVERARLIVAVREIEEQLRNHLRLSSTLEEIENSDILWDTEKVFLFGALAMCLEREVGLPTPLSLDEIQTGYVLSWMLRRSVKREKEARTELWLKCDN